MLALFAMYDGCAGVLAEGKDSLHSALGIAQELQGHVFVVLAGFRIVQDRSHLLIMGAAEHELAVMERLLRHKRKRLWRHLQNGFATASAMAAEFRCFYQFLRTGNLVVLGRIRSQLEHRSIFEFCHY